MGDEIFAFAKAVNETDAAGALNPDAANSAAPVSSTLTGKRTMRDYTRQIARFWPTIMQAWEAHAKKRPVIECDLAGKTVRAYASREYIDSLSERTRATAHREFARTVDGGGIMVFILDTKNRVLQSYSFPDIGKGSERKPKRASQSIARPRRVRKR